MNKNWAGLLDGMRYVAHELFGLATDDEVNEVQQKIDENR